MSTDASIAGAAPQLAATALAAAAVADPRHPSADNDEQVDAAQRLTERQETNFKGEVAAQCQEVSKAYRRLRFLRNERNGLLLRLNGASSTSSFPVVQCPAPSSTTQHSLQAVLTDAEPTLQLKQLVTSFTTRRREPEPGQQQDGSSGGAIHPPSKPISSFHYHGAVSLDAVAPYMLQRKKPTASFYDAVAEGLRAYEVGICAPWRIEQEDVCWFFQNTRYVHPPSGLCLSYTSGCQTPECLLSIVVSSLLTNMKCMCLVREHEAVRALTDPSLPPQHKYLKPRYLQLPPLDPAALAQKNICFRVGVNQKLPLHEAMTGIVQPFLRKCRDFLPYEIWRGVCMHCMRQFENSIPPGTAPTPPSMEAYHVERSANKPDVPIFSGRLAQDGSPQNEASFSGEASVGSNSGGGGLDGASVLRAGVFDAQNDAHRMAWELASEGMIALISMTIAAVQRVLEEPPSSQGHVTRALSDIESDMMLHVMGINLPKVLGSQNDPIADKKLEVLVVKRTPLDYARAQRVYMRVYNALQLHRRQKEELAARWRSWCRRRAALSSKLAAAMKLLQENLPSADSIPMQAMHIIEGISESATETERAVEDNSNAAQHSQETPSASTFLASHHQVAQQTELHIKHDGVEEEELLSTVWVETPEFQSLKKTFARNREGKHKDAASLTSILSHLEYGGAGPQAPMLASPGDDAAAAWWQSRSYAAPACMHEGEPSSEGGSGAVASGEQVGTHVHRHLVNAYMDDMCKLRFLGACGTMTEQVAAAIDSLGDVHQSDSLMHAENNMPFSELTVRQQGQFLSAYAEYSMPHADIMCISQIASQDLAREALFEEFTHL